MTQKLLLLHNRAAGDITVMTALVRDIALTYPDRYAITVQTPYRSLWYQNTHVAGYDESKCRDGLRIRLCYGAAIKRSQAGEPIHFLRAFHDDFKIKTGIDVPLLYPRPDLHLSTVERTRPVIDGRYWVLVAGYKSDLPAKRWLTARHQQLVLAASRFGIHFVQAGAKDRGPPSHHQPVLAGVTDLTGKTGPRDFMRLIYHADGIVCGVTFAMHVAAAFNKPCVVLAGGREAPVWEWYHEKNPGFGERLRERTKVNHRFLHTLGRLTCPRVTTAGCWRQKLTDGKDEARCTDVMTVGNEVVGHCQELITVEHVLDAMLSYYRSGELTPIGDAPAVLLPDGTDATADLSCIAAPQSLPVLPALTVEPTLQLPIPVGVAPVLPPVPLHDGFELLDHLGGKLTIFILAFGDFFDMHRRCFDAVLATVPLARRDLRILGNEVAPATRQYIQELQAAGQVALFDDSPVNRYKYVAMHQAFHDPAHPIATPWLLWLDDDTDVSKNTYWLLELAKCVLAHPDKVYFGPRHYIHLRPSQIVWAKQRPWWTGRPLRLRSGLPAPNANCVFFATGSFWLLRTDMLKVCDIPDPLLIHQGGDYLTGLQLSQQGHEVEGFSTKKESVNWSSVPRRSPTQTHWGCG